MTDETEKTEAPEGAEAQAKPKPKRAPRKTAAPKAAAKAQEKAEAAADAESEAGEEKAEKPAAKPRARRAAAKPKADSKAKAPASDKAKAKEEPSTAPPVVRAQARYVRSSARKARLVCDHIRGKTVTEARAILAHTPRAVSRDWIKLLESAVANAEHNHELIGDELRIASVFADEGPTLKRFRPRAMGRATRVRKRTSHLTITLTPGSTARDRGGK
jgi:ribosomal protein L22